MKAHVLLDADCTLGEGIQWNIRTQRLYWADIHAGALWSCDADGDDVQRKVFDGRLCSFCFDPDDNLLIAFDSGLFQLNIATDKLLQLSEFENFHISSRYNDGRCDRDGNFVVGGVEEHSLASTTSLTRYRNGEVSTILHGIGCANAICFSPDSLWMYFSDSPTGEIWRYAYSPDEPRLGPHEVIHRASDGTGMPDGSCVDAEGVIWNARFNGSCVIAINHDGQEQARVHVDAPQATCACFGGERLDRLYITTARERMTAADIAAAPLSGSIFVCEPGSRGLEESRYGHRLFLNAESAR